MAAKLCNVCNIRRPQTGAKGTETSPEKDMCNYCWEEGGMENQHSDHGHDAILANGAQTAVQKAELDFMSTCWICHPELNLAKQTKKHQDQKNSSVAGFTRRPQLNHKGHSHPATPAARRACKALFWAETPADLTDTSLQQAMDAHDAKLDGFGKPVAPAPAKLTVAPLGPKGGVSASLKAAGEQVAKTNAVAKKVNKFLTKAEGKKLYGK